jgi:uncharacterized protein (TIGR00369 family)
LADIAISEAEIYQLCQETPFMAEFNLKIRQLSLGFCEVEVPFQERFTRPGGIVFGPVFMTASDAAAWFALMTHVGQESMMVTSELNTAFLKPAIVEPVICQARVLKFGKKRVYVVAQCQSEEGELFTHHTVTYFRAGS